MSQEAALDQQAMTICVEELRRCQLLSPKPNFIVLLGDRYGWRPLPERIPAGEFEQVLTKVSQDDRTLLLCPEGEAAPAPRTGWYRKDHNAVPPEYILRPREVNVPEKATEEERRRIVSEEATDWERIERQLRRILMSAIQMLGWPANDERRKKYEQSATHQEIQRGALEVLEPESHVLCYFRKISALPENDAALDYRDVLDGRPDTDASDRLAALKTGLKERIRKKHLFRSNVPWQRGKPVVDTQGLCEFMERELKAIIARELASFQRQSELEREKDTHRAFALDRSVHFLGRTDLLTRIADYIRSNEGNAPFVIHGKSGSGKTALMAKAWLDVPRGVQRVARFIGATPGSSDLRTLLQSLCREMGIAEPPSDMNELVKQFRARLAGPENAEDKTPPSQPVVLFLDALDQLNPNDSARMLGWLPRKLAPGVRTVLSALETSKDCAPKIGVDDPYDIARRIWPAAMAEIGPLDADAGAKLLDAWLADERRTLQPPQRRDILEKFSRDGTPLYLKLAFQEAHRWRSWDGLPVGADAAPGLSATVEGVLDDLFSRLDQVQNHGRFLRAARSATLRRLATA